MKLLRNLKLYVVCISLPLLYLVIQTARREPELISAGDRILSEPCRLPEIAPYHHSIKHLLGITPPLKCSKVTPDLFYTNGFSLCFNKTAAEALDVGEVACTIRNIFRVEGDAGVRYGEYYPLKLVNECFRPEKDVFQISCKTKSWLERIIYDQIHLHIAPTAPKWTEKLDNRYNVVLLMIDAMSRANVYRQLKSTNEYLAEMGGIEFRRHLRVASNTYPNLLGFFTGIPLEKYPDRPNPVGPYDDWPLLTYDLRDRGYLTMMSEEWQSTSLFVQYGRKGFKKQAFTHDSRPFWNAVFGSPLQRRSTDLCYGNKPMFEIQNDYLLQFLDAYPTRPKFGFNMILKVSHDYLNKASTIDAGIVEFLKSMTTHLNNTFFVFFSDHGLRFHKIRETQVGKSEENRPYLTIVPPTDFRTRYPTQFHELQKNANVGGITTILDLRQTIIQISHGMVPQRPSSKGISFFEEIPDTRTCEMAGIPLEFCACDSQLVLPRVDYPWVANAANALVDHLNVIIDVNSCSKMTLIAVQKVVLRATSPLTEPVPGVGFETCILTVEVSPSGGLFEANVRYDVVTKLFLVVGKVSRINRYGNQPRCIDDDVMRPYCYCPP